MEASESADAAGGHPRPEEGQERPTTPVNRFQREVDVGMTRMMGDIHAAPQSGDPDIDFLAMMIPHHAGAIEMARLLLLHGKDPLTRRLASDIIASQSSEIAAMRQRLAILRRGERPEAGSFPALDGTRGEDP
jgi:uncharacterized protein (DUF305 family)